tara:strand:- start:941 stop:1198 length:258 start_codon:yes stop_codon:yes gene_type:complete
MAPIKPKKKPLSKYQKFLKKHKIVVPTEADKSAMRMGFLHQQEEAEASPGYAAKKKKRKQASAAIMKAEKARRARAKRKAKPMGK